MWVFYLPVELNGTDFQTFKNVVVQLEGVIGVTEASDDQFILGRCFFIRFGLLMHGGNCQISSCDGICSY